MGKWIHRLSDIDSKARTATCAECGPVSIRRKKQQHGTHGWRCNRKDRRERSEVKYRRHLGNSCERCGFVAAHPAQLDIHHRDHAHSNNNPENLETICANCHRLEHVEGPD